MPFSIGGTQHEEVIMGMYESIGTASAKVTDRVTAALVAGLEREFGHGAGQALAARFLDAEEVDFRWDARIEERWLGLYESPDDGECEFDRIAICGRLDGRWFAATMLVDGEGRAHGMTGCRSMPDWSQAREAMLDAR
jgi:hypothetical protein